MPRRFPRFKPGEQFGLRGPNGELILDKKAADLLNATAAELKRLGKVSVTPPLRWTETPSGRRFACDFNPEIMVKLSGAGPQYSFVQQQYDPPTHTWSDMTGGRTGTSNCYESKGKSGLAGKIVQIEYQPTANDWRFQWVGYGCHLGPCIDTIPEVLSFYDTYYGVTMAALWTPTSPADPCGAGSWIAYNMLDYPGSTNCGGITCPPATIGMRYVLGFSAGLPTMTVYSWGFIPPGCPTIGGTIPDGPWSLDAPWGRISWSCTPTFSAAFGRSGGGVLYDCRAYPTDDVRLIVSTPP